MSREVALNSAQPADPGWEEIQGALEEIARLAATASVGRDFQAALLQCVTATLGAVAGVGWLCAPDGTLTLEAQWQLDPTGLELSATARDRHRQLVGKACARGTACVIRSGTGDNRAPAGSEYLLAFAPIKFEARTLGVLEIVERVDTSAAAQQGNLQFLTAAGELAADFYRRQQLRDSAEREAQWRRLEEFVEHVHSDLDPRRTAYAIANEGRRLIECDRVSVARATGRKVRLVAVSGVEAVDRRSNVVRQLEELGRRVVRRNEPLWYPASADELPPELETVLDALVDESQARMLAVIPLKGPADARRPDRRPPTIGVLFVERFRSASIEPGLTEWVQIIARHAASALSNAVEHASLPLLPLDRALRGAVRWTQAPRLSPKILLLLAAAAAVAALVWVPADFNVEARGELEPRTRREIFAPDDAVVSEIRVAEGQQVHAGDVLVSMRKPQLEFELHRVLGEMQTARKKLTAVQAARLEPERTRPDKIEHYNQLTAEEEEIKQQLASLEEQEAILRSQQAELVVRSPIDGQVLTWNVQQLLETRPVQRGQVLMTVGDLAGPWQLELRLPDRYAGYLLDARRSMREDLKVSYLLATDPGAAYEGRVKEVALAAETDAVSGPHVLVTVDVDRQQLAWLRPGATVLGKVECGRRSLGFVWLHDLIAAIRSQILF